LSIGQSAISFSVRLQPSHSPEVQSIRQTPVQGLGGELFTRSIKQVLPDQAMNPHLRAISLLFAAMHTKGPPAIGARA
jgi:hypothetical protein